MGTQKQASAGYGVCVPLDFITTNTDILGDIEDYLEDNYSTLTYDYSGFFWYENSPKGIVFSIAATVTIAEDFMATPIHPFYDVPSEDPEGYLELCLFLEEIGYEAEPSWLVWAYEG